MDYRECSWTSWGAGNFKLVTRSEMQRQRAKGTVQKCNSEKRLTNIFLSFRPEGVYLSRKREKKSLKWWYASEGGSIIWKDQVIVLAHPLCAENEIVWCARFTFAAFAPAQARGSRLHVSSCGTIAVAPIYTQSRSAFQRSPARALLLAIAIWAPRTRD